MQLEICPKCKGNNVRAKLIEESNNEVFKMTCLDCLYEWYE